MPLQSIKLHVLPRFLVSLYTVDPLQASLKTFSVALPYPGLYKSLRRALISYQLSNSTRFAQWR
jgi:hypothetical protein